MLIKGVIPVLQTPFDRLEALDLRSLERQVDHVCRAGAQGVVFPGFVSEWWKLTEREIYQAAEAIAGKGKGKLQLIFNITAQATRPAVRQAREFSRLGADALMCLPPFITPLETQALLRHLRRLLSAADLPHVIQYAAGLTGLRLVPEQLRRLKDDFPHFNAVKVDFIPPGPAITHLMEALGREDFTCLVGYAGLQLPDALSRGAHGLMGGAGHVEQDVRVFELLQQRTEEGLRAFEKLLPLLNFEMQTVELSLAVHKRLLKLQGVIDSDRSRAPGLQLDSFQEAELSRHAVRLGIL